MMLRMRDSAVILMPVVEWVDVTIAVGQSPGYPFLAAETGV
jgi:hypothetical protein